MANYQLQRTFFWPFNFLRNVYNIFILNYPLMVFSKKKSTYPTNPNNFKKKKKEKKLRTLCDILLGFILLLHSLQVVQFVYTRIQWGKWGDY